MRMKDLIIDVCDMYYHGVEINEIARQTGVTRGFVTDVIRISAEDCDEPDAPPEFPNGEFPIAGVNYHPVSVLGGLDDEDIPF